MHSDEEAQKRQNDIIARQNEFLTADNMMIEARKHFPGTDEEFREAVFKALGLTPCQNERR